MFSTFHLDWKVDSISTYSERRLCKKRSKYLHGVNPACGLPERLPHGQLQRFQVVVLEDEGHDRAAEELQAAFGRLLLGRHDRRLVHVGDEFLKCRRGVTQQRRSGL